MGDNNSSFGEKNRNPSGLKNTDNTCYVNAVVQQLYMNPYFRGYIINSKKKTDYVSAFKEIFCQLHENGTGAVDTASFIKKMKDERGDQLNPEKQNDAHEFLTKTLERIDKEDGEIAKHCFAFKWKSQIKCKECSKTSENEKNFNFLPLDIRLNGNSISSIQESIKSFSEEEINEFNCEECKKKSGQCKKMLLCTAPNTLIVQLKRFDHSMTKICDKFEFTEELDLSQYWNRSKELTEKDFQYNLVGVIVHRGDMKNGHYYSLIKKQDGEPDKDWYEFDDESVKLLAENEISKCYGGDGNDTGYVLFYQKKKPLFQIPSVVYQKVESDKEKLHENELGYFSTLYLNQPMNLCDYDIYKPGRTIKGDQRRNASEYRYSFYYFDFDVIPPRKGMSEKEIKEFNEKCEKVMFEIIKSNGGCQLKLSSGKDNPNITENAKEMKNQLVNGFNKFKTSSRKKLEGCPFLKECTDFATSGNKLDLERALATNEYLFIPEIEKTIEPIIYFFTSRFGVIFNTIQGYDVSKQRKIKEISRGGDYEEFVSPFDQYFAEYSVNIEIEKTEIKKDINIKQELGSKIKISKEMTKEQLLPLLQIASEQEITKFSFLKNKNGPINRIQVKTFAEYILCHYEKVPDETNKELCTKFFECCVTAGLFKKDPQSGRVYWNVVCEGRNNFNFRCLLKQKDNIKPDQQVKPSKKVDHNNSSNGICEGRIRDIEEDIGRAGVEE